MPVVSVALHHNIVATSTAFEDQLAVATTPERFEQHLNYFEKSFDLIDLETLINGPLPRKPLLLTFDDCYKSVMDVARDTLAPRGISSVLFTNPDHLGPTDPSLDNVMSWYAAKHGLQALHEQLDVTGYDSVGQILATELSQKTATERHHIREKLKKAGGMTQSDLDNRSPILTHDDLRALSSCGVEVANHTASHVHCRSLTADERQVEFTHSKQRLEDITGKKVRAFSVPYGNEADLTPEVLHDLRASGHEAIFLVHARSNRFQPAPDIWYRTSLHNEEISQLPRKFNITPILRSIRHMVRR